MDTNEALELAALAEAANPELKGLDARSWRDRLEMRLGDLSNAFELLLDEAPSAALRMATAMSEFWRIAGRIPEGRTWLDRSLGGSDPDDAAMPRALYEDALLAFWQGDDEAAGSLLARSLTIAASRGDKTAQAVALCGMARMALRDGDLDRARKLCQDALARVEGTDDRLGRSNALHVLGVTAQMRGDLNEAAQFMNHRIQMARELNLMSSVAAEACNLSVVERQLGNYEHATELALEALLLSERRGDEWILPYELSALAAIAAAKSDFVRAATLLGAAARIVKRTGTAWPPDEKPHFEQTRAAAAAALAEPDFDRAWLEGGRMSASEAIAYARAAP